MKKTLFLLQTIGICLLTSCDMGTGVDPSPTNYIIDGSQDLEPAFSPDGQRIAYFHDAWEIPPPTDYPSGLYIINKDGTNRQQVLTGHYFNSPSWSPDGEWLVFSTGTIQKCKTNGDSLTIFTGLDSLENPEFYFPFWSDDGMYILFDNPFHPDAGLYSMTSLFENPKRAFGLTIFGRDSELSPNGKFLVYMDWVQNWDLPEIFIADTSGIVIQRLTQNAFDDRSPTWSNEGDEIAWSSGMRLSIMNVDGTNQRVITYGNSPSWSVNDQIVYSYANDDYSKEVLFVIDADGKNKRQITN